MNFYSCHKERMSSQLIFSAFCQHAWRWSRCKLSLRRKQDRQSNTIHSKSWWHDIQVPMRNLSAHSCLWLVIWGISTELQYTLHCIMFFKTRIWTMDYLYLVYSNPFIEMLTYISSINLSQELGKCLCRESSKVGRGLWIFWHDMTSIFTFHIWNDTSTLGWETCINQQLPKKLNQYLLADSELKNYSRSLGCNNKILLPL